MLYIQPIQCKVIADPFFGESRLNFVGITEPSDSKQGVRFHNRIVAFFLRLFGKIIDIKDVTGKVYHLNRNSLINWCKKQNPSYLEDRNDYSQFSESTVRGFLTDIAKKKSPPHIVTLSKLQFELSDLLEKKIRRDSLESKYWSIFHKELDGEIEAVQAKIKLIHL